MDLTTEGAPAEANEGAPVGSWTRRLGATFAVSLWPLVCGLGVLAVVAVLTNHPGSYVADNRFEQFWSPGGRLLREAFIWDGGRDLGRVREDFWPGSTAVIGLLRGLGASPALAQHLWHAVLLVVAGSGMAAVMRAFLPRIGAPHALAGLFYMFSPFSAAFLLPSGLYLPYALAPWMLTAFVHGVRRQRPWRWAATFALVVFAVGTTDPPGLAYACLPLLATAIYLVHVERSTRWTIVVGWSAIAAALTVVVSAAALTKVTTGAAAFARRLAETEAPENANVASSWAETWRGLGFWLSYFRDRTGLQRPQTAAYFTNGAVILLTFVPAALGLFALWRGRLRARLAFAAMMLLSLVAMVGAYGRDTTPYGRILLAAYRNMAWLGGLRNSYKAGAGLMIGLAALFALGVSAVAPIIRRRVAQPWVPVAGAVALVGAVSYPFWTGHLYPEKYRTDGPLPGYWTDALAYLDGHNDGTRVLVLPGSTRSAYRWGFVGDDIFDALLKRPHVVPSGVPLSNPQAANVVASLAERVGTARYEPGTLGPIARRLGIGTVVIRNDLDWERLRLPRPARFESLRTDPDLERVATFGRPGSNVVAARDKSLVVFTEAQIPPVEVYAVRDAVAPVRAQRSAPPLLVSGDGEAWPQLAQRALLSTAGTVTYTGDLSARAIEERIEAGSPLTITDTNRRRLTLLSGAAPTESHTLAAGEDIGRPTPSLFDRPGTQSVAWFPDASRISSSSPGSLEGFQPAFRAANAFDGNDATAWWTAGGAVKATGHWVRADLRAPKTVSAVDVEAAEALGPARRPTRVRVLLSDGSSTVVSLVDGKGRAEFRPRRSTFVELRIDAVEGEGQAPVGLKEVRVEGLDLSERIQVPDDVLRAASRSKTLAAALDSATVAYQFERVTGAEGADEERALRRRFRVAGTRTYHPSGRVQIDPTTSDQRIDTLVGGPIGAYGSSRAQGLLVHRGGLAVDGRLDTGWIADANEGETLTIRFPERVIDHLDVVTPASEQFSTITEVRATVGDQVVVIPLAQSPQCARRPGAPPDPLCLTRGLVGIPPTVASQITIEVTGVEPRAGGLGPRPMEIIEAFWDFAGNAAPVPLDAPVEGCTASGVLLDGQPLPLRVEGTYEQLLAGEPVPVSGCQDPSLGPGWHEITDDGEVRVNALRLESAPPAPLLAASDARLPVVAVASSPTRMTARYTADGPTLVTTGQSYDDGWVATVNGRPLGRPEPGDTLSTWSVAATGDVVVEMRFEPERQYSVALGMTALGVVVALVLALWRGRHG